MTIRLFKVREYGDKTPMLEIPERKCSSIPAIFTNIDSLIQKFPIDDRYNLHYSLAHVVRGNSRGFIKQDIIPFDIDKIDTDRFEEYIPIVLTVLNVKREDTAIVYSGNGLHFLVQLNKPFNSIDYFKMNRFHYKVICTKIEELLSDMDLPFGEVDANVFRPAATLRLPNTENRKKNKPLTHCRVIQAKMKPIDFSLSVLAGMYQASNAEINSTELKIYPTPDEKGVRQCPFLTWCYDNQEEVVEPQWYAMLGIVARLPNGEELAHEYSKGHPSYEEDQCQDKIEQSLNTTGPRTCSNIESLWGGCMECPYRSDPRILSPINITTDEYIKTKEDGFYNYIIKNVNGETVRKLGKPNYEDLRKYYEQLHPYKVQAESKMVYLYKESKWKITYESFIENFAQVNFNPAPLSNQCSEFKRLIQRTNITETDWFNPSGLLNLQNGVLNMDTMEMTPRNMEHGFTYCLDHHYDEKAECPKFDQFLKDITCNREDIANILLEFLGYSISNMSCKHSKILILFGEGSNGKSTLMDIMKALVGRENYSSLDMEQIKLDSSRYLMHNALFNLSEETPHKAFLESSIIKNLATGGDITARRLYHQQFSYANKTKLIMAANDMPANGDVSFGMFRRLLIVPFDAEFVDAAEDKDIKEGLMQELSGILNRCITGYKRLVEQKGFTTSSVVTKELQKYKLDSDSVCQWSEDLVVKEDNAFTPITELYLSYSNFCEIYGMRRVAIVVFSKRIRRILGISPIRRSRTRGYSGITLLGEY